MLKHRKIVLVMFYSLTAVLIGGCTSRPEKLGLAYSGRTAVDTGQVRLLVDETWMDAGGTRHVQQEIFDAVFEMINEAERFILVDMFLLNDYGYVPGPGMRPLSREMADCLTARKEARPELDIVFISDPVNTVYGSIPSPEFSRLEAAGVKVVWTELDRLRDSNPVYSKPWRLLVKPFGTGPGKTMANPIGDGRVSLRSYLKLLNFKANHRKLIVTDKSLLVTSANPHSASSAHWNAALQVDGAGMGMAVEAEKAILRFSGADRVVPDAGGASRGSGEPSGLSGSGGNMLELLTERRIKERILELLARAPEGARIDLSMFYLSDREVISAFTGARERGCRVRVILDPSKDAFGRVKNGIPNRQSAARLVKAGIPLRWAETHGEQCHVKTLYVEHTDGTATLMLGSSNYTRRNLDNFNCEADLAYTAPLDDPVFRRSRDVFERWWNNEAGRIYTAEYAAYEDPSRWRRFRAWWKETTGMGTF